MRRVSLCALVWCIVVGASTARADTVQVDVTFYASSRLSLFMDGTPNIGVGWVYLGAASGPQMVRVTSSGMNGNTLQASGVMAMPGKPQGVRWNLTVRGGLAQWVVNTGSRGAVFTGRAYVTITP